MKKYLTFIIAGALAGASFSAWSVQPLTDSNLDDLQDKLAEKARQEGAKGFVVNAAGGDNHMYGTATIYK